MRIRELLSERILVILAPPRSATDPPPLSECSKVQQKQVFWGFCRRVSVTPLPDTSLKGMSRAAKRGCFKRGCFPIWTCPSLFVLFCPFWDFPDFSGIFPICSGMVRGFFPICPFPLSRPIKSTYEEQSRKGPRHNLDLSRKKWETPGFGNPPV